MSGTTLYLQCIIRVIDLKTIGKYLVILSLLSIMLFASQSLTNATSYGVGDEFTYVIAKQVFVKYFGSTIINTSCLMIATLKVVDVINNTIVALKLENYTYLVATPLASCQPTNLIANITMDPNPNNSVFLVNPNYSGKARYSHEFTWRVKGLPYFTGEAIYDL